MSDEQGIDGSGVDGGGDLPDPSAEVELETPAPEGEFTKEYVQQLRQEAQGYRLSLREYEDIFGDEQGQTWKQAAALWREDPVAVAQWMAENAQPFLDENGQEQTPPAPGGEDQQGQYVTAEQLQQMLEERDRAFQESQALAELDRVAEGLGYQPDSPDYVELLWFANNQTDGDLEAAHGLVQKRRQDMLDQLLEEKRAEREGGAQLPPSGGGTPSGETQITSWKDAKASAEARIANAI